MQSQKIEFSLTFYNFKTLKVLERTSFELSSNITLDLAHN